MDKIARLKEILKSSRRAVFFGGAGMSTESGIPDFRSAGKKDASRWLYRIYQCFLYYTISIGYRIFDFLSSVY